MVSSGLSDRDICRFHGRPLELSAKVLDVSWSGYFGEM